MKRSLSNRALWAMWALLGVSICLLQGACRSAPPTLPSGQLWLELSPAKASVLVDDRPLLGRANSSGTLHVMLPPGPHRVEVYAPGYFHAYRDIAIGAASPANLRIALRADPDAP